MIDNSAYWEQTVIMDEWGQVRMRRSLIDRLNEAAKAEKRSAANLLETLLEAHLAEVKE